MLEPTRPSAISASSIWDDAGRLLMANAGLIFAVAGALLFLPAVIEARYFPSPAPPFSLAPAEVAEWQFEINAYLESNWWWVLISTTSYLIGTLALYILMLSPRITVAAALGRAFSALPFYVLLSLMFMFAVGFGALFLIVPGIFLAGKLILSTPILAIETPHAPVTALRRSWERSARPFWTIGILLMIVLTILLVMLALNFGLGAAILLLFRQDGIGGLLLAIVQAAMSTLFAIFIIAVIAAIYRAMSPATAEA